MEPQTVSTPPTEPVASTRTSPLRTAFKVLGYILLVVIIAAGYLWFFEQPHHSSPTAKPGEVATTDDARMDAIRRGVEFIKVHQESDGEFSRGLLDPKPGFTALVVDALARSPDKYREKENPFLEKSAKAILSHQQPNGAISTPAFGLDTYTTACSIMALSALENPAYAGAIEKAKQYLLSVQYRDDEENANAGGPGYNVGGRTSGDLAANWVEALKEAGVKEGDPAFENAKKFLSRLQNNSETNNKPAPGTEIADDGGFFYRQGESKAADEIGRKGLRVTKSYGLMSYAGLKSFLYLKVGKDDPRIAGAWRWVKDNYTLEENKNIGADGLYYYYLTMAKALAEYGDAEIVTADGVKHVWAKELSDKLISLQRKDGAWRNASSSRWKEDDPVMVTAFAIRTLTICHEFTKQKSATAPTLK